jgi:hypothetical protein
MPTFTDDEIDEIEQHNRAVADAHQRETQASTKAYKKHRAMPPADSPEWEEYLRRVEERKEAEKLREALRKKLGIK